MHVRMGGRTATVATMSCGHRGRLVKNFPFRVLCDVGSALSVSHGS